MSNVSAPEMFSCLNSTISSVHVTNKTFWTLQSELHRGSPAVAVVIAIFFVIAFSWNGFILLSFAFKHHLLREPGNIFLFNLALVDFLVTVSNMFITIVSGSAKEFVFGSDDVTRCTACGAFGFLLIFLIAVSLHTLAALSVDRFILLAWPLRYKFIVNRCRAITVLCLIWFIGFLVALPPVLGFGQQEFNTKFGACLPRFVNDRVLSPYNFYYVLLVAVEALFPLLILAVTNIWTYKIVSKFLRKNFRRRQTFHEKSTPGEEQEGLRHHQQQQQLVKVFSALFIAHLISWTPVIVVVFIIVWVDPAKIPPQIYIFGWICYLTNPVAHPIIETFFVKDLRYQVRRVKNTMTDTLLRAGSTLYRKASSYAFNPDAVEEANRKLDEEAAGKKKKNTERERRYPCKPAKGSAGGVRGPQVDDGGAAAVQASVGAATVQCSPPDGSGTTTSAVPPAISHHSPDGPGLSAVPEKEEEEDRDSGSSKQISTSSQNLSLPESEGGEVKDNTAVELSRRA